MCTDHRPLLHIAQDLILLETARDACGIIRRPVCRTKHQKEQQYPLNREGFGLIKEDLRLMCDNCHTYNKGNKECEESADMMWAEATKQLDVFYKKALNDIASLMSGHRTR